MSSQTDILPVTRIGLPRSARRRPIWSPRLLALAVPLLVPALLLVLWLVAADRQWMSPQVLPAPALVWETARELSADNLWPNLAISLQRLAWGLLAGSAAGIALGVAMGLSRRIETLLYPTFLSLVQIPTLAWIPLLIILLGLGETLKIAVIVKAVVTPLAVHAHIGVRDIEPRLAEAARALRLPRWHHALLLVLPASLPPILTGLRLGLAQAWISLLAVELLASSEGIGFLMVWGRQLFQLDIVFVCIAIIGAVGWSIDAAFQQLDRRILRWPRPALAMRPASPLASVQALILPAAILALWAMVAARGWINGHFLPPPAQVATTLITGLSDGSLIGALLTSLSRSLWGLAIGGGCGLALGLIMGLWRPADRLLSGTLTVLRLVAIFAWLPLLTAWVGLGEPAKIAFIAIACFFPLHLATQRGVAGLSPHLAEVSTALRLGWWDRLHSFILPGAAPAIFAGLRLALISAWIGTVGAEYFMASGGGIGSTMIAAQQLFRMDVVLSAMALIGLVAAGFAWLGNRLEDAATRWRTQ